MCVYKWTWSVLKGVLLWLLFLQIVDLGPHSPLWFAVSFPKELFHTHTGWRGWFKLNKGTFRIWKKKKDFIRKKEKWRLRNLLSLIFHQHLLHSNELWVDMFACRQDWKRGVSESFLYFKTFDELVSLDWQELCLQLWPWTLRGQAAWYKACGTN